MKLKNILNVIMGEKPDKPTQAEYKRQFEEVAARDKSNTERFNRHTQLAANALNKLNHHKSRVVGTFNDYTQLISQLSQAPEIDPVKLATYRLPKIRFKKINRIDVDMKMVYDEIGKEVKGAMKKSPKGMVTVGVITAGAIGALWWATGPVGAIAFTAVALAKYKNNLTGDKLEEARKKVDANTAKVDKIVGRLEEVVKTANRLDISISRVEKVYQQVSGRVWQKINNAPRVGEKVDVDALSDDAIIDIENLELCVRILYSFLKIKIIKSERTVSINSSAVNDAETDSKRIATDVS